MNLLEVKNLTVKRGGKKVVKDINFSVERGEMLTVLGPNGAGKSTLFKALMDIIPYQGEIKWKDVSISYLPESISRENFKLVPLTVLEFLLLENKNKKEVEERLGSVGLSSKFLDKKPSTLSSGEFQRILIAWALLSEPEVLLFDEPTGGIDLRGRETIYSLLYQIGKEKNLTILIITHEMNIVFAYSDNVLCVNKTKLCYGKPEKILTPKRLKELYGHEIKFYKHNK